MVDIRPNFPTSYILYILVMYLVTWSLFSLSFCSPSIELEVFSGDFSSVNLWENCSYKTFFLKIAIYIQVLSPNETKILKITWMEPTIYLMSAISQMTQYTLLSGTNNLPSDSGAFPVNKSNYFRNIIQNITAVKIIWFFCTVTEIDESDLDVRMKYI